MPTIRSTHAEGGNWFGQDEIIARLQLEDVGMLFKLCKRKILRDTLDGLDTNAMDWETLLGRKNSVEEVYSRLWSVIGQPLNKYRGISPGEEDDIESVVGSWSDFDWLSWACYHVHTELNTRCTFPDLFGINFESISFVFHFLRFCGHNRVNDPSVTVASLSKNAATPTGDQFKGYGSKIIMEASMKWAALARTVNKTDPFDTTTRMGKMLRVLAAHNYIRDRNSSLEDITADDDSTVLASVLSRNCPEKLDQAEETADESEMWLEFQREMSTLSRSKFTLAKGATEDDIEQAKQLETLLDTKQKGMEVIFSKMRDYITGFSTCGSGSSVRVTYKHARSNVKFYPWQCTGACTLVRIYNNKDVGERIKGAILADATGLGKTLTLALAVSAIREKTKKPTLYIVYNAVLLDQAVAALESADRFMKVTRYHGNHDQNLIDIGSKHIIQGKTDKRSDQVVVTTLSTWFSRHNKDKERNEWDKLFGLVVIDEAHVLRNADTQWSHLFRSMNPDFYILATATPWANSLRDMVGYSALIESRTCEGMMMRAGRDYDADALYGDNVPESLRPLRMHTEFIRAITSGKHPDVNKLCKVLQLCVVKRGYRSRNPASTEDYIGADMPTVMKMRVFVDYDTIMKQRHDVLYRRIARGSNPDGSTASMRRYNGGATRQLNVLATSPVLAYATHHVTREKIRDWYTNQRPLAALARLALNESSKYTPERIEPFKCAILERAGPLRVSAPGKAPTDTDTDDAMDNSDDIMGGGENSTDHEADAAGEEDDGDEDMQSVWEDNDSSVDPSVYEDETGEANEEEEEEGEDDDGHPLEERPTPVESAFREYSTSETGVAETDDDGDTIMSIADDIEGDTHSTGSIQNGAFDADTDTAMPEGTIDEEDEVGSEHTEATFREYDSDDDDTARWNRLDRDVADLEDFQLTGLVMSWSPKLEALSKVLGERNIAMGAKAIVVCQSPTTQAMVWMFLKEQHYAVDMYSSAFDKSTNADTLAKFNRKNNDVDILVTTYHYGMIGIDLHLACHLVIAYDTPTSYAQEVQAIGRVRRIGQDNDTVEFIEIITRDSVQAVQLNTRVTNDNAIHMLALADQIEDGDHEDEDDSVNVCNDKKGGNDTTPAIEAWVQGGVIHIGEKPPLSGGKVRKATPQELCHYSAYGNTAQSVLRP